MKKIIFKMIPLFVLLCVVFAFTACGENATDGDAATYEDIYNEYSVKIQDAAPTLVDEFNAEATALKGDLTKLAELSNNKIEKLAEISVEGTGKMAEIQLKNGDEYSVYSEWADKLNEIYEQEAKKITDAYMSIAVG